MRLSPNSSRTARLTIIFIIALSVYSCAATNALKSSAGECSTEKNLWQYENRYIRIVPQVSSNAPPNDHPVRFTPQQLGIMLDSLTVTLIPKKRYFTRKSLERQTVPVFTDQELRVLSEAVSSGLEKAGPRDDIVFAVTGNHAYLFGGWVNERLVTTGRIFYCDDNLNIIFGEIHGDFQESRGAGALVAYPSEIPKPPTRASTPSRKWTFVTNAGVRYHVDEGRARINWVAIDPLVTSAKFEEERKKAEKAGAAAAPVTTTTLPPEKPSSQVKTAPAREIEAGPDTAEKFVPVAPATHLREQLKELKRLHDEGLVSDEIYQKKVEELLDKNL